MATFHDRTTAPIAKLTLLRGGRAPCRVLTDAETIAAINLDACHDDTPTLLPEPGPEAAEARAFHSRRALVRAADHGVALLAALNLPRLVEPDFVPFDPVALGDALDVVIAYLDALDALDEDLEPYLAGSYNGMVDPGGEREDEPEHDEDDDPAEAEPDKEPSLGWPNDYTAALDHRFDVTDYDVEATNEDGDDCGEAHAPWWDRIGYTGAEGVHG